MLQVERDGEWEAAAFFSRQLHSAKQRYSATESEALALVATIDHFNCYLYGKPFIILTDHRPLEQLLTSDKLNSSLRRMAYKLQHWMIEIRYIQGDKNTFADALSREGRKSEETPEMSPDVCLVEEDVEGQPPLKDEEERQQSEEDNLCGKP